MKNCIFILFFLFLLKSVNVQGQPISYNVVPPSCANCCDGSFTMTVLYTNTFAFLSYPVLPVTSWSANVLTFTNVCSGTYTIHILGSELMGDVYDVFTMPLPTGLENENNESKMGLTEWKNAEEKYKIYPNPVKDFLSIETNFTDEMEVCFADVLGREVKKLKITSSNKIDVCDLEKGIYLFRISNKGKSVRTQKLVKE